MERLLQIQGQLSMVHVNLNFYSRKLFLSEIYRKKKNWTDLIHFSQKAAVMKSHLIMRIEGDGIKI